LKVGLARKIFGKGSKDAFRVATNQKKFWPKKWQGEPKRWLACAIVERKGGRTNRSIGGEQERGIRLSDLTPQTAEAMQVTSRQSKEQKKVGSPE